MPTAALLVIGGPEWLWIILAVAVIFGASRIPQIMRGLGGGIREFKDELNAPADQKENPKLDGGSDSQGQKENGQTS